MCIRDREKTLGERIKRKVQEQYLAIQLEKDTNDKSKILEQYMNTINLGQNTLGVQAASKRYFNKNVWELSLSECATIAGITQNPSKYNPLTHPDKNQDRREKVLTNMLEQGYITQAQYDEAESDTDSLYRRIQTANLEVGGDSSVDSYYADAVKEAVTDVYKRQASSISVSGIRRVPVHMPFNCIAFLTGIGFTSQKSASTRGTAFNCSSQLSFTFPSK